MEYTEYVKLVADMRKAQKEYFTARKLKMEGVANEWLRRSKDLERAVDKATNDQQKGVQSLF